MKFRLSTLLLVLTMAALALGWLVDRRRLVEENRQLNAECADLFCSQTEIIDLETDPWPHHFVGTRRPPRWSLYDATDPADRQAYRENRPSKLMAGGK